MRGWLGAVVVLAVAAAASFGGGAGATAAQQCTPGATPSNDPLEGTPHPEETAGPVVIGCWSLDAGKVEVHGRRMNVPRNGTTRDTLCLGTANKVVCLDRWPPKKGRAIAGTSCGGGDGFIFVEGTVSTRVRRVDVRFEDAKGRTRSRRASVVWLRGKVAETLRTREFGYYRGETARGATVIETVARDREGRALGRLRQTGCNRPR